MIIPKSLEFTIKNYLNIFVLDDTYRLSTSITLTGGGDDKKKFGIHWNDFKYTFHVLKDNEKYLILYSYDGKDKDCVTLTLEKDKKSIVLTSFGKTNGCYRQETNVGSNLLKITLRMVKKFKDYFGINKIVLGDNSEFRCKTGQTIDMAKMKTLLTGHTWYGRCCQNNNCPRHKDLSNLCTYGAYRIQTNQ